VFPRPQPFDVCATLCSLITESICTEECLVGLNAWFDRRARFSKIEGAALDDLRKVELRERLSVQKIPLQAFKWEFVAKWGPEWTISCGEILSWLAARPGGTK
jgi:hypothetical protein